MIGRVGLERRPVVLMSEEQYGDEDVLRALDPGIELLVGRFWSANVRAFLAHDGRLSAAGGAWCMRWSPVESCG